MPYDDLPIVRTFDFRDEYERTVAMALTDEIRPQNVPGVLARAIANRDHGERAWALVKERWAEIGVEEDPGLKDRLRNGHQNVSVRVQARSSTSTTAPPTFARPSSAS